MTREYYHSTPNSLGMDEGESATDWQSALYEWDEYYPKVTALATADDYPAEADKEQDMGPKILSINSSEIAPWLNDEERSNGLPILHIEDSGNHSVVVVDARTDRLKDIEAKMARRKSLKDFEGTGRSTLSDTLKELGLVARQLSGSLDGNISGMKSISSKNPAYPLTIFYRKRVAPNVPRVYVCQSPVDYMPKGSVAYDQLRGMHIDNVLFFVAACVKQTQVETLALLTGYTQRRLRHTNRAGAV